MNDIDERLKGLSPGEKREFLARLLKKEAGRANAFPLSFAQERLWFLEQLENLGAAYNVWSGLRFKGPMQIETLGKSINEIVRRHEVLRTTFSLKDGQPVQVISGPSAVSLPVEDLQDLPTEEKPARFIQMAIEEVERTFDLEKGPLLRTRVFRLNPGDHALVITLHHIVSDAWSMKIFIQEMLVLYKAYTSQEPSPLPGLPLQYADFAAWQRRWLSGEVLETQVSYWKKQMAGAPAVLELPFDHPRPLLQTYKGKTWNFEIHRELTHQLEQLSQHTGTTLFMVLTAAFSILLSRLSGKEDIIIGTPSANRSRRELESLIGLFLNTLLLRLDLSGAPGFCDYLHRVRQVALEAYAHQDVPFEKLVEELKPERNLGHSPLFQVLFSLQNVGMEMSQATIPDSPIIITPFDIKRRTSKFDLGINLLKVKQRLRGILEYNPELFEEDSIIRMVNHFQTLLAGIAANPQQEIFQLPLLTEDQRHRLLVEWNNTAAAYPKDKTIQRLFEEQVEQTPDAIAIAAPPPMKYRSYRTYMTYISYRELNEKSDRLAYRLKDKGAQPGSIVGLMVERSMEMIIAVLGILKAGSAYLPINPNYPENRIKYMLADSRASILLATEDTENTEDASSYPSTLLPFYPSNPLNLAYIIYTSGSTGKPKGVMVRHRNVINFISGMVSKIEFKPGKTILAVTEISFDISVLEILLPLTRGMRLVVVSEPQRLDPRWLAEIIVNHRVDMVQFTPSQLMLLLSGSKDLSWLERIKELMIGGETLPDHLFGHLKDIFTGKGKIYNLYGPTETTVWSIIKNLTSGERVTIGAPIANTSIYIIDHHGMLQPVGIPGELCIGGDGVTPGYLNNPELTVEKFHPDFYRPNLSDLSHIYRTGDLARWLANGEIQFLGRMDSQVKIRGFRIELSEIEKHLLNHKDIKDTVVVLKEDKNRDKYLCAYIVAEQELSTRELQDDLSLELPDYMIPSYFVFLEKIPLNPHGKIDWQALPEPGVKTSEVYVSPRDEIEKKIAGIWSEVLEVPIERIGIHDTFFSLGGHSLKAIKMAAKLEEEGIAVTINQIFIYPSISGLAEQVKRTLPIKPEQEIGLITDQSAARLDVKKRLGISSRSIRFNILKKEKPVSVLYKELFRSYNHQEQAFKREILGNRIEKTYTLSFTQTLHLSVGTHNLELAIPFDTYLDRPLLNGVILGLVQQQGLMRSILINEKGRLKWQQHAAPKDLVIPYLDISDYGLLDQERILSRIRQEKSLGKFTTHSWLYRSIGVKDVSMMHIRKYLEPRSVLYRVLVKITSLPRYLRKNCRRNSLLYRLLLVRKNLHEHLLLIRLDHIIGDDNSLELIKNHISQYYNAGKQNQPGQAYFPKIIPYDRYVEQVNQGPRGINPQRLVDFLEVEEYKHYSTIVSDFIDRENTKRTYYFNYQYPFKGKINLKEEQSWEIGFILVVLLCREIFNIPKIPAKLIYYGRNYGGSTYFNTIGEFWDLIPLLIELDEAEPLKMVHRVNQLVELAAQNNINFVSMFLNKTLYESWKPVIDLVAPKRLTPPESMILIDFLGKRILPENRESTGLSRGISPVSQGERRRRRKERYVNLRNQGGFLIYIRYTSDAVSIDLHSLVKINDRRLKLVLDEQAGKILANLDCLNRKGEITMKKRQETADMGIEALRKKR